MFDCRGHMVVDEDGVPLDPQVEISRGAPRNRFAGVEFPEQSMSGDELDTFRQNDIDSRERYRSKVALYKANEDKETYMTADLVILLTQFVHKGECYGGGYRDSKARPT